MRICLLVLFTLMVSLLSSPPLADTCALIIGDSVIATTPEIITAIANEKANSLNSIPVKPDRKPMGAYTAANVNVIDIMGTNSCLELSNAACFLLIPSRIKRDTFSTTTMASQGSRAKTLKSPTVTRPCMRPGCKLGQESPPQAAPRL